MTAIYEVDIHTLTTQLPYLLLGHFFRVRSCIILMYPDMVVVTATAHDLVVYTIQARKNILKTALAEVTRGTLGTTMVTGIELAPVQCGDGELVTGTTSALNRHHGSM